MRPDQVIASWMRTKRAMRMSARQLERRREKLWQQLQPALARTPALAAFQGQPLSAYPITDTQDLRADYGKWNSLGLSHEACRAMAEAAETGAEQPGISAGWSTGSGGGDRGLFLASPSERADYLGQSLARLLPASALLKRQRLALHLRASNALYSDVQRRRFAFAHFPLERAATDTIERLRAFDPTILIAPPHRLVAFARSGLALPSLRHLFHGSEPMSAAERALICDAFGVAPRAIYQATEGFLGAECCEGSLHLNENAIHFEFEPIEGTSGFRPIITDLRRTSQPVVRLRTDDFIELDDTPCPCGFGGRVIKPPLGRVRDIWSFEQGAITPPQVVKTVEAILGADYDWQASATPKNAILHTHPSTPPAIATRAVHALEDLTGVPVTHRPGLHNWSGPKRRKVVWCNE